jgi:hypothetical protein
MTACPLTIITLKCTGVPITQLEKSFLMKKVYFGFFWHFVIFFYYIKMFLKNVFIKIIFKCNL